ncbi:glycosyltransferase [Sinomonas flava]|uniref:glycosyltransferase n=1 Tax=Sinomonas flava TaxID=496857 RepID=UPI0039A54349
MADQQLAAALARRFPVLYVEPPESAATRIRTGGAKSAVRRDPLELLEPGLIRFTPEGLPGLSRPGIGALNARLSAVQVRAALRRLRARPMACLEGNVMVPVMGRISECAKAYWAQDDAEGMAPLIGGRVQAYARATRRLAEKADIVIAANPVVAKSLEAPGRTPLLIPFGCDAAHFSTARDALPAAEIHLAHPYAVFMGHLGERIELPLLERLVDDGGRLLLVGPVHPRGDAAAFHALARRAGVQWVGAVGFERLPTYLTGAAVGLVPYNRSRFNLGSFPLKALEYLAAGLPVVATPLPAMSWIGGPDVHMANTPELFSAAVRAAMTAGRDDASDERRRSLARAHSWDARALSVLRAIGLTGSARLDSKAKEPS